MQGSGTGSGWGTLPTGRGGQTGPVHAAPARDHLGRIAAQANEIADGWSGPDAPASWRLTAETFRAIAEEPVLLELAAGIPAERLPPLLLSAAVQFLVAEREPPLLTPYYPLPGGNQPALDGDFRAAYVDFCVSHRAALAELCGRHRYQMNEVGRSAAVLPVLGRIAQEYGRPLALVDLGTGAGLGLQLDRYRYRYRRPRSDVVVGEAASPVELACMLRGGPAPVPSAMPAIVARVGVDVEPLDVEVEEVRRWLAACIPPEAGAVTRFASAVDVVRAHPERLVRGDLVDALPAVVADLPAEAVLCVVDTFVHVFLTDDELARFREVLAGIAAGRAVEWVSVDPLIPLGPDARRSVQGHPVAEALVEASRRDGVFGLVGRLGWREGARAPGGGALARAHPSGAWLDWLA